MLDKASKRRKAPKLKPPQISTLAEADNTDRLISDLLAKRAEREAQMIEQIKLLEDEFTEELKGYGQEIVTLFAGLQKYAQEHREELLPTDKKSRTMPGGGELEWYLTKYAIVLDKETKTEEFVERLKRLKLERFVRTKESVNKQKLLEEPEVARGIEGITVREPEEKFVYTPRARKERLEYNLATKRAKLVLKIEEDAEEKE